ncbi:MAG: sulfite exporter TauE/SafE family protein [Gammaproteobacteria bacterium]|nr:sulfite exporter TauE/SafE family protein [Gammaproteobacteria bacterium]
MAGYDFFAALVVGFLGGGHCLSMCGGIVGVFSANIPIHHRINLRFKLPYLLSYNCGRILSYCTAGALIGFSVQFFALKSHVILQLMQLAAGTMLVLLGLYIGRWFNGLTKVELIGKRGWQFISPWAKHFIPFKHPFAALPFGMIWGWLPCGLVYSTLTWAAASASPTAGALIMLGFGLGTLPAMLAIGVFSQQLASLLNHRLFRSVGALVIIIYGLKMIYSTALLI